MYRKISCNNNLLGISILKYGFIAVLVIGVFALGITMPVYAQENKFPPRFQAVLDYLLKDEYPELFNDKPYQFRPTGYDIGDLDGDGVDEVVVSFYPHFLQSPTIVIFRVNNNMKVTRITEGLAPGKLIPLTGDYLDSHSTGHGIDLTIGKEAMSDPDKRNSFIKASVKNMGSIVVYRNFIHTDGRSGKGTFIDMLHIENPPKELNCSSFEFARVEQLKIGRKNGEDTPVIIALAGEEVYFYKIKAIDKDGFIDKTIEVVPLEN